MKETSLVKFILVFWFAAKIAVLILPTLTVESIDWLIPVIVSTLYIMISVFVLTAGGPLANYNIDLLSLIILLLFETIFRFDNIPSNGLAIVFKAIVWIIAGAILFRMISGRIVLARPTKTHIIYVAIGIVSGILLALVEAYLIVHKPNFRAQPVNPATYTSANYLMRALAYDASNGAVPEEFIFRGLFFGYLVRQSYSEKKAHLVQACAFWLSHFDRMFVSPIGFWLIIPTSSLLFSLLAWRSRSLVPSVAAHTLFNTFQVVLAVIIMAHM